MKETIKRRLLIALSLIPVLSPFGCATCEVRSSRADAPSATYPAVKYDIEMISICYDGGSIFHGGGRVARTCGYTVVPLCWTLDIPLSAITDTVCLPRDLHRITKMQNESNQRGHGTR